jgi:adenine-specific DNA-methyltransferase
MAKPKKSYDKVITHFQHEGEKRKNIPTAELQSLQAPGVAEPKELRYPRNPDLDPQLVWRGKDQQDWSDLVVPTPPLYIQEKVHPKALIDDLLRRSKARRADEQGLFGDLFQDFDGLPKDVDKTEFYQHDSNWSNRMILGDSLQVMASLAEREGLRGKVQCIYFDPPYGIKFNSNFQWSTTSRDVKDGKADHITREPEQVKAFRDTWRDGINSYLTYLRDRLTVARDLLTESGSIFVQIGDDNVHRVRALLDEVFGEHCFVMQFYVQKTTGAGSPAKLLAPPSVGDYVIWYTRTETGRVKYRELFIKKEFGGDGSTAYKSIQHPNGLRESISSFVKKGNELVYSELPDGFRVFGLDNFTSQAGGENARFPIVHEGKTFTITNGSWKTSQVGVSRLQKASRIGVSGKGGLGYVRFFEDFPAMPIVNVWTDTVGQNQYGHLGKTYVVQTAEKVVQRCLLMASDPGDLVLDPTCGSGTTAYVAEQWGRRWITIDTSRVALALARARIMGAKFPFYLLSDSVEGQEKQAEVTHSFPSSQATYGKLRQGFVYERVPHITLKSIANNAEIDVIWDKWNQLLEPILVKLNKMLSKKWQEWEVPRDPDLSWSAEIRSLHSEWWVACLNRQKEVDASIWAKAEFEHLYDRPYEDVKKVRVAGPFTVESLTPYRTLAVDADGEAVDLTAKSLGFTAKKNFAELILENLRSAGVQQAHKEDKISFSSLKPWAGKLICAEGHYQEGDKTRRAAIFIGPEFGTIDRPDLVEAAREAADAKFDALIACAFSYSATTTDLTKLGPLPVLKARMNADLHMAEDLKSTGKGNLFVIFGEPDIDLITEADGQLRIKIKGVDVFKPQSGKVESSNTDEIACWFIDTDYNEESFFVRHAYFLGANDPYDSLKKSLKAEIDQTAWETLHSDTSRPFPKPKSQRIAVKVINHLGDEVMRIFKVA